MPDDIKNMFNSRFNMENISKINKENSEKYKKNIEKNFEDFFKMKKKQLKNSKGEYEKYIVFS